jgi:hypothetical protein
MAALRAPVYLFQNAIEDGIALFPVVDSIINFHCVMIHVGATAWTLEFGIL